MEDRNEDTHLKDVSVLFEAADACKREIGVEGFLLEHAPSLDELEMLSDMAELSGPK